MAQLVAFGEYRPDVSDYNSQFTREIDNVCPRADGYGPVQAFNALTAALPAACRGAFHAHSTDGSAVFFAGISTRLYRLDNSTLTWSPVSKVTALTSISNASPAVFTLASHGLVADDALVLSTTGALPAGLTVGTVYYVISAGLTSNAFEVSTSIGGAAVNTSSAGSGTHSMTYFYAGLPTSDHWQFEQFGTNVIAVQANVAPQVYDLATSAAFADLGGSPPQAAYIGVVGSFLVLSGLLNNPFRVQWSGLDDITEWTSGTNSSDFQDLPDGGIVYGVGGGEFGVILQEHSIRRMVYVPGSPLIFTIERLTKGTGVLAPYSIVNVGLEVFFLSSTGFLKVGATGVPVQIGKERVDRTFFSEYDSGALHYVIGASDPTQSRIYWSYRSAGSPNSYFNRLLVYDVMLNRWTPISGVTGEYLARAATPGITLENLDSVSSSIDALTVSLDDISTIALDKLGIANTDHIIGFLSGLNLEATLETAAIGDSTRRVYIGGIRPVTDAPSCYAAISKRETLQATAIYGAETAINSYGVCPQHISTRYPRGKIRIPAETVWTFASGVEPEFALEGEL